jgi:hypothetical protein
MALFGGGGVDDLIARRKYAKAIELLQAELNRGSRDPRMRLQLADVLILENRGFEAVPLLLDLADEMARDGQAAKAIALLKKVQRFDPGRKDVDVRLASMIKGKNAQGRAWAPREGSDKTGYEPAGAVFGAEHFGAPPVVSDADRIAAARGAHWTPSTHQDDDEAGALPVVPAAGAAEPVEVVEASEIVDAPPVTSPLFEGFSQDELVAFIRGLRLLTFEAGDIILTQGDTGDSLFVLTTGRVKTFLRREDGRGQHFVRELSDGAFFGEISILSGKPRSATVTAAVHCELLELDRATLDGITRDFPRVREVLEEFYVARASSQDEEIRKHSRDGA